MKRQSWIILAVCAAIIAGLLITYSFSQAGNATLSQQDAVNMSTKMEQAFESKNVEGVMAYISPAADTRISNISPDQLRSLLSRFFRNADKIRAELKNYSFVSVDNEATLQFDVSVHNDGADSHSGDYEGHLTLHIRRVEVPQLFGLFHSREWRITGVDTTGPDLSTFGD